MIGWLLNTENSVYHPINDLGMLYPSAYVTDKPNELVIGTLTPVRDSGGYGIIGFRIEPFAPWQVTAWDDPEGNNRKGST